jgi:hypothetical protein
MPYLVVEFPSHWQASVFRLPTAPPMSYSITGVIADDPCANLVNKLSAAITPTSHVIGSPEHIHSIALGALRLEEVFTPHLLQPLAYNNSLFSLPPNRLCQMTILPAPIASCG